MTSFTEQLSAVRQSQWEAQLDIFRRLSSRALDSTEQLVALNMKTSRASMEQAAGTIKHILEAKDPRDLFAVGSAVHAQVHQMFDYGRELLGIATGLRGNWSTLPQAALPAPLRLIPAPTANFPTSPAQVAEQAAIATLDAVTISGEIGAAAADIGSAMAQAALPVAKAEPQPAASAEASVEAEFEKTVDTAIADEVPPAEIKPLAKALNEAAPKPASVEHPIVSTVPLEAGGELELPAVAPVEHTPAPVQAQAPAPKPPRASRKK
jgi:phasin family protein